MIDDLFRDLRYAARTLLRSPGFAATAILSLALGIGANTAIFSVVNALMLRSLPVDRPGELVVVTRNYLGRGTADFVTYPTFERLRDAGIFASITASMTVSRSGIRVSDGARTAGSGTASVGLVSGTYFSTLGVQAQTGRLFTANDARAEGSSPVAVLSDAYWRREFEGSSDAVGRTLTFNDTAYAIVGVLQRGFNGEDIQAPTDFWIPITMQSQAMPERAGLLSNQGSNWIRAIGRLPGGTSIQAAEAAARAAAALPSANSQWGTMRLDLQPAGRGFAPQREVLGEPLEILSVIVGLVLLIACANVATLLSARAAGRQREFAVRLAIGAERGRLVRQLLAESALIAVLAGAAGFALAIWMTQVLAAMAGAGRMALGVDVGPDATTLVFTGGISLVTGLMFGLLPALRATRPALVPALTGAAQFGGTRQWVSFRGDRFLVVAQVAASIVLTMAAGLSVRTLRNLETQHLGFDVNRVWLLWMAPERSGKQHEQLAAAYAAAADRVSAVPGVVSVSPSDTGVLSGFIGMRAVTAPGHVPAADEDVNARWTLVSPGFFDTIGMRRLAGRDFGAQDTETSPHVAIVNEAMVRHFFGGTNPVGKRFAFGRELTQLIEIVGVVEDAKYFSAREADVSMVFLPYRQDIAHLFRMCVVVRTATDSPAIVTQVRTALQQATPDVPVTRVDSTAGQLDRTLSEERLTAWLASFFSVLAVTLAGIGLYGVISYMVTGRTRDIGIRMALGESREAVIGGVLLSCGRLVAAGLAIGIPLALVAARYMQASLFGVQPFDATTIAGAVCALTATALAAGWLPARRASAVNPIVALRTE